VVDFGGGGGEPALTEDNLAFTAWGSRLKSMWGAFVEVILKNIQNQIGAVMILKIERAIKKCVEAAPSRNFEVQQKNFPVPSCDG
jgi:hypothetical protein